MAMEQRKIGGSIYSVPVGTRPDWRPGQPFVISPPAVNNSNNRNSGTSTTTNTTSNTSNNWTTSPYDPIRNTGAGVGIANVGASAGMIVPPGVENREASFGEVLDILANMSQNQQAGRESSMDIEERTPEQFSEYLTGYEQQYPVTPAQQAPVKPVIDLSYQMPAYMSWEEALRQAGLQLDPQTELSRLATLRAYMEQRERLPQLLNARGQLYGGLRAGQEAELTQDERRALDELALRAAATKSEMAQGIQESDYARAKSIADAAYQNERDRAELLMQQWQAQQDLYNREQDRQNQSKMALVEILARMQEAAEVAEQQEYERQRQEQQDKLAMEKWLASPESQDWYLDLAKKSMQADIANALRSANAPYGGGGGSGSNKKSPPTDQTNDAFLQDATGYINDIASGKKTYDGAIAEIDRYMRAGVMPTDYGNQLKASLTNAFPQPKKATSKNQTTKKSVYPDDFVLY